LQKSLVFERKKFFIIYCKSVVYTFIYKHAILLQLIVCGKKAMFLALRKYLKYQPHQIVDQNQTVSSRR